MEKKTHRDLALKCPDCLPPARKIVFLCLCDSSVQLFQLWLYFLIWQQLLENSRGLASDGVKAFPDCMEVYRIWLQRPESTSLCYKRHVKASFQVTTRKPCKQVQTRTFWDGHDLTSHFSGWVSGCHDIDKAHASNELRECVGWYVLPQTVNLEKEQ